MLLVSRLPPTYTFALIPFFFLFVGFVVVAGIHQSTDLEDVGYIIEDEMEG